jgi:ribosomal protein L29
MKKDVKKNELRKLDKDALIQEIANTKKELFNLSLSFGSGEIKDYSQFKKLKKTMAQGLTFLKRMESGIVNSKKN